MSWTETRGKRRGRLAHVIAGTILLGLSTLGVATAQQYEQPMERRAADVLPAEIVAGPNHRVQDAVLADGYMYRFVVDSPFGNVDVTGSGALRKLAPEIQAIAALREMENGDAFGKAVLDPATGPFRFAKNLITYRAAGFKGKFDLWLTGMASPLAKQRLGERGMTVTEEVGKRVEIID